jgi:radical SAM superfamily enzyme YgiQ (UPF0313 family)
MLVTVHLVSMPWSDPEIPSIQLAVLKGYLDATFGTTLRTETYSAFRAVVRQPYQASSSDLYDELSGFEEFPYFLLCLSRFVKMQPGRKRTHINKILRRLNDCNEFSGRITQRKLACLAHSTEEYLESAVVPCLNANGVNLIGFTLNYYQLYASLYSALYLKARCREKRLLFIFGGATVIYPSVISVMNQFDLQGICIAGEGEQKLETVVRQCQAIPAQQWKNTIPGLAGLNKGIFDIRDKELNLYELDRGMLKSQVTKIDELPAPTFDEYFAVLEQYSANKRKYSEAKREVWIPFEGSRGCFAKCDFCDVHTNWQGFRKGSADRIVREVLGLARRHHCDRVAFMDNVCDTWAEKYAESLISRRMKIRAFMELRVHHPETFWTKLSLSGVEEVQVGIEAFVQDLLNLMNKGTHAEDNLLVHKWLKELGIQSSANLISHHPKSTVQHVVETKAILKEIPHLDRLSFSNFGLLLGSPIDNELSRDERRHLDERTGIDVPKQLRRYFTLKGEFEPPRRMCDHAAMDAWTELEKWEQRFFEKQAERPFMTVQRIDEALLVCDGRTKQIKEFYLEDKTAQIYELGHRGFTLPMLADKCELMSQDASSITNRLLDDGLLIRIGDHFISLALRSRDELIANVTRLSANGRQSEGRSAPLSGENTDLTGSTFKPSSVLPLLTKSAQGDLSD